MYMKKYSLLILMTSFLIYGCEDKNKIAEAQACLDAITDTTASQAKNCLSYLDGDTSQQAYIIRCSAHMMAGGLITSKIVSAYKALSGTTSGGGAVTNKEAVFIGTLTLSSVQVATEADEQCKLSQVSGLMYISGLALMGTTIAAVGADIGTYNNPPTQAEVDAAIDDCTSATPTSALCNPATIGGVATTVATAYCASQSADQSVCSTVNDAITAGGGDATKIGNGLLCLLKKGTYDPNTNTCT